MTTPGRVRAAGAGVQYTWPGTYFEGRFRGTGVGLVLNDANNDYVVQVDGPSHLSPEGRLRANALERRIADAAGSLPPTTVDNDLALQARLDSLTSQLREVIDEEVQQGNVQADGAPQVHAHVNYRPD